MYHACTPILVGVTPLVSEILLLPKTAKFPFRPMDYSPWSSRNLIDWNQLKKNHASRCWCNMHVHQFWWVWPLWFRRYCYLQKRLRPMDYSPWSSKNLIDRNRLKKIMQVGVDVTCMHTNFGGRGLYSFGDIATFKNRQISPSTHGL